MIAAGGLGTRVQPWAQTLPKEFAPSDGAPAIIRILSEIAAAFEPGTDVVMVYHPYYQPFIRWAADVLRRGGLARYRAVAGLPAISRSP